MIETELVEIVQAVELWHKNIRFLGNKLVIISLKKRSLEMWDFFKNLGDKASQNADGLKAFGSLLGAGAGIWSAVEQGRQAKKQNDLAMKNYNLNMQILKDEKARQKKMQQNLEQGWAGATANIMSKEEEEKKRNGLL